MVVAVFIFAAMVFTLKIVFCTGYQLYRDITEIKAAESLSENDAIGDRKI